MKNIFINEAQYKMLKESVFFEKQTKGVFSNEESSLSPIISQKHEEKIIEQRELEVHEVVSKLFGDDMSYSTSTMKNVLSRLMTDCIKKEEPIKEFLEKLCHDSVFELFDCPQGLVHMTCELVKNIDNSNITIHIDPSIGDYEFEDSLGLENTEGEIQKRMLLNTLIIGASVVLSKFIIKRKREEIYKLDNTLYNMYEKLLWLNEFCLFQERVEITDKIHNQTGGVDVTLGSNKKQTIIESRALCFPILLFESIKGFFELFISHGLPSDKKMTEYILDNSDSLKYHQYSIIVGPVLWNRIMSVMHTNRTKTSILPHFASELSQMDIETLNNIMKEIALNTKLGKSLIKGLVDDINNNIDYEDFEERLDSKRHDKNVINDEEYIGANELIEDFN